MTGTVEQVESQSEEIQDLRARLIMIEKAEANRQADSERVRHEQLQTLNEMKQLAEQAKTIASNFTAPPTWSSPTAWQSKLYRRLCVDYYPRHCGRAT